MKRAAVIVMFVVVVLQLAAFAKPKRKEFNNTPKEVFDAALRTARERHVVTYVDEPHLMFTFETGKSIMAEGFIANASVEPKGENKSVIIINVQHKIPMNAGFSFNAGDRMTDKFYSQVAKELARTPAQRVAEKPEAEPVPVPAGSGMNSQPQQPQMPQPEPGLVTITSNPVGADVTIDGSFVGNAPATLKLKPGRHTVTVQQTGYALWSRDLTVLEGASTQLNAILIKE